MAELRQRPGDQPLPVPNEQPSIQSMVRADLDSREQVGVQRYGTPLQPHNGRDAMRDAYEEALDLTCYLRQVIAERPVAGPADGITDEIPANTVTERWVTATPDEVTNHSGDGHRYARWGQCVISYDEEREPIPAVYSSGWNGGDVEFGADHTWRLSLDEAEAFISRLQHAIAYERARTQGGGSDG